MSTTETPGSHLARLRVQYGGRWRIDRSDSAYVARQRSTGSRIQAATLAGLEGELISQGERAAGDVKGSASHLGCRT
jgi:hypothetical protein